MKTLITSALLFFLALPSAAERIQFQCGGLEGFTYYAEENLVPKGEGGWERDKISSGESIITLDTSDLENTQVTYMYKDATGAWYNPESEGGSIVSLGFDPEDLSFMFFVIYPSTSSIELITVAEISESGGRMIYSTMRNSSAFMNAKLMTAECTFPEASVRDSE
jgi:hypothetical protein